MPQEPHRLPRFALRPRRRPPDPDAAERARLAAARAKAAEYSEGADPLVPKAQELDEVQSIEEWGDLVSKRIEEAMRRGDFDNLPGRGKPLAKEEDSLVPESQRMAFKLLRNNDLTPDWIAERREVQAAVARWREDFRSVVGQAQVAWAGAQDDARREAVAKRWETWLARWEDEIVDLNRRITLLNLKQPINHLEIFKVWLDEELRAAGCGRTLDESTAS